MAKKQNSLTSSQSYNLRKFICELDSGLSCTEIVKIFHKLWDFCVTESNVKSACQDVGYELRREIPQKPTAKEDLSPLKYVIARCDKAGVHAGFLESRKDGVITLRKSRRLWRWWSKFTLSGLAMCGVLPSKVSEVKFSCEVDRIDLTESDVCEIIYTTQEAEQSIRGIKEHSNE